MDATDVTTEAGYIPPMGPSPKGSKWSSTPQAARRRRKVQFTLSDEARAKLDRLAEASGGGAVKSKIIEDLIMAAEEGEEKRR